MAKPNYSFEKRRRELAKKQKKEEKRLKKSQNPDGSEPAPESQGSPDTPAPPSDNESSGTA